MSEARSGWPDGRFARNAAYGDGRTSRVTAAATGVFGTAGGRPRPTRRRSSPRSHPGPRDGERIGTLGGLRGLGLASFALNLDPAVGRK